MAVLTPLTGRYPWEIDVLVESCKKAIRTKQSSTFEASNKKDFNEIGRNFISEMRLGNSPSLLGFTLVYPKLRPKNWKTQIADIADSETFHSL